MNISQREKILIFVLLCIIIGFVFVKLFYLPQHEQIAALQAEHKELVLEKQKLEKLKQEQQADNNKVELAMQEYQELKSKIPFEEEVIPMMRFLETATDECGLPLTSLTYKENSDKNGDSNVGRVSLDISTTGFFFELVNFLQALENAPRLISIEDINFNGEKKCQSQDKVENVTSKYYIPPPGVPEAKGLRVKPEEKDEETVIDSSKRVADSFERDKYKMSLKITMYYSAGDPGQNMQESGEKDAVQEDNSHGGI